jgi:PilZ domain
MSQRAFSRTSDRRFEERARFQGLFVNKHIDGLPHLARLLDLSAGGMMVRKVFEPELTRSFFSVELAIPWTDERFWIWARCVRETGDRQAIRFMGLRDEERARLAAVVAQVCQPV